MTDMNRRQLLRRAVLGGAGTLRAAAFGPLAQPAHADTDTVEEEAGQRSRNFAQGLIQAIEPDALIVTNDEFLVQRIQLTTSTRLWKVHDTTLDDVQVGDFLYARGEPGEDGQFIAETVWVNIVNVAVEIVESGDGQLQLLDWNGPLLGYLTADTVAIYDDAGPPTKDLSQLQ